MQISLKLNLKKKFLPQEIKRQEPTTNKTQTVTALYWQFRLYWTIKLQSVRWWLRIVLEYFIIDYGMRQNCAMKGAFIH